MRYAFGIMFWTACAEPIDVPSEDGTTQAPEIAGGVPAAGDGANPQTPPSDGSAGFGDVNLGAAPPTMGTFAGDLPDLRLNQIYTRGTCRCCHH